MAECNRCGWCETDPLYTEYHDTEWGVPVHDDRRQFEFLILEGAQAGLSWLTILKRRDGYRKAFANFDPEAVARFDDHKKAALHTDTRIIRNRAKIQSAITNARAFLRVQEDFGSFDAYIWRFVDGRPICNCWRRLDEIPTESPASQKLSRDLKSRGFTFVGPVIIYAHMQATGMVNDHLVDCFRYHEIANASK